MEEYRNVVKITIPKTDNGKEWDYLQLLTIECNIQDLTELFKGCTVFTEKGLSVRNSQMVWEELETYQFWYNKESLTKFSKMEAIDYLSSIIYMLQKKGQREVCMQFDSKMVKLDSYDNILMNLEELL